jgi:CRISPR/Cas system-associated exonuclease Cas4 (RecB family)
MKLSHSHSAITLFENCPLRYFYQRVAKAVQDQGGEASMYGERIHKALEDRLKEDKTLPQEAAHYEPLVQSILSIARGGELLVEQELTLSDRLVSTGWWDADAWLRSKLDVLVLHGNRANVMDWKTGKRKPDFSQLELFALQVFKHYPEVDTVQTSFIWLKTMEIDKETFHRVQANEMWAKLLARITRIEQALDNDNWPAKPSGLCKFCPARHMCDYARV